MSVSKLKKNKASIIFQHFLCKEFSEENILFWEACEGLRTISPDDADKMKHDIKAIYDRYSVSYSCLFLF